MKTKIKIFSLSIVALVGLFAGANFVSAQTVPVTTCSSVTVYGTLTNMGGAASVNVWFEWGATSSFGNTTATRVLYTPQTFNEYISGLSASTVYYYRAVFSNAYGVTYGSPLSFSTTSCGTGGNTVPVVTTNTANSVSQNGAVLNGYVTANGSTVNAWFEYGTTQSFGNQTPSTNYGNTSTSISASVYNLAQNSTYYYRAVAQNSYGVPQYGTTLSFTTAGQVTPPPTSQSYVSTNSATSVSTNGATLNGYMTSGGTNTSAWFEWGTSYSLGNTTPYINYGTGSTSYNTPLYNLNPNTTYYYRAAAQSAYGTIYGSIISFTTGGAGTPPSTPISGTAPVVTTLLATETTGTEAKLNGLVFSSNDQSSNAWFEWGSTSSLGNTTTSTSVGNLPTVKHSDYLSGLIKGQTYYYRIVAQNTYGKQYGTINSFVSTASNYAVTPKPTPTPKSVTPVVRTPVTTVVTRGSTTQSLVTLSIDGGADMIMGGEKRTYHVAWKNVGTQDLNDVVLRVTFPASMKIDSATEGVLSSADNSVVVDLKTLAANENGEAFIFATASRGIKAGELLVVTANMVYTGTDGVQGDAIAYVTHTAQVAQSAISANVFGAGDFVPTTLLGWVSLLTLVLVLVFVGNHLYGRLNGEAVAHH